MNGNAEVIPLSAPPRSHHRAAPTTDNGRTSALVEGFGLGWQVGWPEGYTAGYAAAQAAPAPAEPPTGRALRLVPGGAA